MTFDNDKKDLYMKKNYGLDGLFNRPTGVRLEEGETVQEETAAETKAEETATRKAGRPRKVQGERVIDKCERFNILCNTELLSKVRAIASQENLPIKDVIETALSEIIRRYEKKHGPIETTPREQNKTLMDVL